MRCQQCGQSNPEKNKFCGMCGSKLEPVAIDDSDPLGLEAPALWSEDRAQSAKQDSTQLRKQDRQRELLRDAATRSSSAGGRTSISSTAAVESFPPNPVEVETHDLPRQKEPAARRTSGIAGPSFLGLGDEGNDSGFVYDKPRNDGFIYDTDVETPEYLLEEVPRGVSWRAWALFTLLLVGAGLGYIQWRASHNQGPDIAAILAGNGATVDPSGPVMTGNSAKPAAKNPDTPATDADETNPANDGDTESTSSNGATAASSSDAKAAPDSNTASTKAANKASSENPAAADDAKEASASASSPKDADEAAKPESDGPVAKETKPQHAKLAPVEAEAAPKPLGDKDPLIVEAERYIQGRGVRQNCSTGINLLHQAMSAGNPAADVKMGALYWSGTCVTQSNVAAYQWFSRAHALEPQNRWIERSRNSLWAGMSTEEKHRVSY